jgi:hypothetical protein
LEGLPRCRIVVGPGQPMRARTGPAAEGSPVTRDELLAWLLLPWNIVKAIAVTVWWIVAALIRGGDDDEGPRTVHQRPARIPREHPAERDVAASVASVEPPRP